MNPQIFGAALSHAGGTEKNIGASLLASSAAESTRDAYQALIRYAENLAKQQKQELEARAEKYDTKLQDQFNEAEPQYQKEAETQLPELAQLIQDIKDENSEAQRQNRREIEANLARQGIRGGQAGILLNRAMNENNRGMQRDINQLAYNEAANRQNSRLNYYGNKAATPWNTMSSAYGSSMTGANNALSNAQGNVYSQAYGTALGNYLGTQNTGPKGWKAYLGGWNMLSGDAAQRAGNSMQSFGNLGVAK